MPPRARWLLAIFDIHFLVIMQSSLPSVYYDQYIFLLYGPLRLLNLGPKSLFEHLIDLLNARRSI
jgi:hypothetical protein